MPELPDIVVYLDALKPRIVGQPLLHVRLLSPFVLRSVDPPLSALEGREVVDLWRLGKRIVVEFPSSRYLVFHLMIAGRLRWREPGRPVALRPRQLLAAIEFSTGTLFFSEVAAEKRASLLVVSGRDRVEALDPGGIEPLTATREAFIGRLRSENHTVKRALTDPRLFSGIGNAYSDEILHAARISPFKLTRALSDEECERLRAATQSTLAQWVGRLTAELHGAFPERVTAFREGMAVHGRYGHPCPSCGSPVQRIVYASNECNYCARCQTGGRLLADRALSRLLRDDWPRSIDDQ